MGDGGLESGIELSQLVLGAGHADLKAFNLAEPALALSFGDPIDRVVAHLEAGEEGVPLLVRRGPVLLAGAE
jgi:hypothetical protein